MKRWRLLFVLIAVVVVLVGLDFAVRAARNGDPGPGAPAEWIWAPTKGDPGSPMAFYAVKDFDIDFVPIEAELRILADEEYQLTVNDWGLAAGRYRPGAPLDSFHIETLVHQGSNRIVVELRSARGVGGLLFRLAVTSWDDTAHIIASDSSWRIHRSWDSAAGADRGPGEEPVVWGAEPVGRWGTVSEVRTAPTIRMLQGGKRHRPRPAATIRKNVGARKPIDNDAGVAQGPWATFDFGAERAGFLNLKFADTAGGVGYVYYSQRRPKDGLPAPDEVIVRARGRRNWITATPALFRYATVVGAPQVSGAEVVLVDPGVAGDLIARQASDALLGGNGGRTLVPPVEHKVRSQLQGVPGLARREEG